MDILIGSLIPVVLFACVYIGYNFGRTSHKPVHKEVDEQVVDKAREIQKGFQDLMSYDVSKAVRGKR